MDVLEFLREEKILWEYRGDKYHPVLPQGFHTDKFFNFSNLDVFSKIDFFCRETKIIEKIKTHISNVDSVHGITEGGILFANYIGFSFNIPILIKETYSNAFLKYKKILLVGDVLTGETLKKILDKYSLLMVYPYLFFYVGEEKFKNFFFNNCLYEAVLGINIERNIFPPDLCPMCQNKSIPLRDPKNNWNFFYKEY